MEDNEQARHIIACAKRLARIRIQEDGESVEEVARHLRRHRPSI